MEIRSGGSVGYLTTLNKENSGKVNLTAGGILYIAINNVMVSMFFIFTFEYLFHMSLRILILMMAGLSITTDISAYGTVVRHRRRC